MSLFEEQKEKLLTEMAKLHGRHELSKEMGPDFFEPGMMEYPEQSDGSWEENTGCLMLRFESKGTRYDGRTEQIEKVKVGDAIRITRDKENAYNPNNFRLLTEKGKDVGNMPAEICNAVAPLYDNNLLQIEDAKVSFVEPISARSRHAKQGILFVEMHAKVILPVKDRDIQDSKSSKSGTIESKDPYALQLDLRENRFFIGDYEIHKNIPLEDVKKQAFYENAKEVPDLLDSDCLHVYLRRTAKYAGEEWVVCLLFQKEHFNVLWLEHAKLFTQRSLLKSASSNPRLRKMRSGLYSKLKKRLNELTESCGIQESEGGNLHYVYEFEKHSAMLVQDNRLPAIVIYVRYSNL